MSLKEQELEDLQIKKLKEKFRSKGLSEAELDTTSEPELKLSSKAVTTEIKLGQNFDALIPSRGWLIYDSLVDLRFC